MPFEPKCFKPHAEVALSVPKVDYSEAPIARLIVDGGAEGVAGAEEVLQLAVTERLCVGLYNYVKTIAKDLSKEASCQNLIDYLSTSGRAQVNEKNSRGSTGLHACGYLKRWDLAQILLKKGADPAARNASGHSFFLTAVKQQDAPWRELLADHPHLIEKHEKYLSKKAPALFLGEGFPSNVNVEQVSAVIDNQAEELKQDALALRSDWDGVLSLAMESKKLLLVESHRAALLKCADLGVLNQLSCLLVLSESECELLIDRVWSFETAVSGYGNLANSLGAASRLLQIESFERAVKERLLDHFAFFCKTRWLALPDLIEECEDLELYDFADLLIDRQALLVSTSPASMSPKSNGTRGVVKSGGMVDKKKQSQKTNQKAKPKAKIKKSGGKSSRSASKIANFDGPVREANDFEYKEKKAAPAPLIIIKKSRVVRPELRN